MTIPSKTPQTNIALCPQCGTMKHLSVDTGLSGQCVPTSPDRHQSVDCQICWVLEGFRLRDDQFSNYDTEPKAHAAIEALIACTAREARIQEVARMSQFGGERLAPFINEYQIKRFAALEQEGSNQ